MNSGDCREAISPPSKGGEGVHGVMEQEFADQRLGWKGPPGKLTFTINFDTGEINLATHEINFGGGKTNFGTAKSTRRPQVVVR